MFRRSQRQLQSDKLGKIDILVNNAGVMDNMAAMEHQSLKMFDRDLNVNLTGAFKCIQAVWPHMKQKSGDGLLIFPHLSV
ncbi:MAG: SDR family oxidoreductase [Desulfobacterales bacterium]